MKSRTLIVTASLSALIGLGLSTAGYAGTSSYVRYGQGIFQRNLPGIQIGSIGQLSANTWTPAPYPFSTTLTAPSSGTVNQKGQVTPITPNAGADCSFEIVVFQSGSNGCNGGSATVLGQIESLITKGELFYLNHPTAKHKFTTNQKVGACSKIGTYSAPMGSGSVYYTAGYVSFSNTPKGFCNYMQH